MKFANDSTARSAIRLIVPDGITKSFARMENTSISPSRVFTNPDSARVLAIDPVLARAFPSARVPRNRVLIVPSFPAIGSVDRNASRWRGSL